MASTQHRIIVHVARAAQEDHVGILRQVENLRQTLPGAAMQVVFQGPALSLLLASESRVVSRVDVLMKEGVDFAACKTAMVRLGVAEKDLIPGVGTVPSALAELVLKQSQGWAYVKLGS